jgi:purine-binding chemotaxis protein CheW
MGSEDQLTTKQSQENSALDQYMAELLGSGPISGANKDSSHELEQCDAAQEPEESYSSSQTKPKPKQEKVDKKSGNSSPTTKKLLVEESRQLKDSLSSAIQPELKFLTLKVGGLNLATPLSALSGVISYPDMVTSLEEQPSWFLGLFQHQGRKIGIVDMGGLIHGEQKAYKRLLTTEPYSRILLLKGGKWAMACDEVGQVIRPLDGEVKWRDTEGSRPWLMGTINNPSAALIDLQNLIPI